MDQLYDIAIVGGGLAGSALAKSMAEKRFPVIVLEREKEFRDRVRGEQMACWGVAESRELGIYQLLVNGACGQEVRWWETRVGSAVMGRRDFLRSTRQHAPQFMFYHPGMQEILASAAQEAGVEYRRGITVSGLETGEPATVLFDDGGATERVSARLVVGADGRGSSMRKWGGFVVRHDPRRRLIAGVLFDRMFGAPSEAAYFHIAPPIGRAVLLVPQGNGRVRAYLIYPHNAAHRLQGTVDVSRFIDESMQVGVPAEFYAGASVAGPLASFDGADNWVEHPYRNGVALVGDAAASNDPCFGSKDYHSPFVV
jgi:menaquinone-9 beta-reductase